MSVQSTFHSTGANNVGFYGRASNAGLRDSRAGNWTSFDFLQPEEGKKGCLHANDGFTWYSLRLFCAGKSYKYWTPEVKSVMQPQSRQAHPMRRNSSLTSPDHGFHLNSHTSSAKSRFKPFRTVIYYEGIRRLLRATEVDCSSGENCPGEGRVWKDEPFGVVWDAEVIAQAVNGEVIASGPPGSISTDSRRINQGEWFLPLVGSNFDGHQFLPQAFDRGCAGYIGRPVSSDWPKGFIRVGDDTLGVLHKLAAFVRDGYGGSVVGITGSTGKTTARAMTALALESLGAIHQTEGNLNNHIGLPLTLLRLPSTSSACVLEMGMSRPGEIQVLAEIAQPTVRVLLNVGPAHMDNFGSLEDVAKAKAELLRGARPGDVCVLNADDPLVMSLALPREVRVVLFGRQDGCHLKVAHAQRTRGGRAVMVVLEQFHPVSTWVENFNSGSQILEQLRENTIKSNTADSQSSRRTAMSNETGHKSDLLPTLHTSSQSIHHSPEEKIQGIEDFSSSGLKLVSRMEFEIPSPGLHLAINACTAAAVAVSLGVPLRTVAESLSKYSPVGMRSRLERVGGVQLVNDTYNSNPMSLESGLNLLGSMECEGRRIALLGDMLELGCVSKKAHMDALALCEQLKIDIVGLVGPSFSEAAGPPGLRKENCVFAIFKDSEELAEKVREILRSGDVVLVKGSRGMKMEIAANAIRMIAQLEGLQCS